MIQNVSEKHACIGEGGGGQATDSYSHPEVWARAQFGVATVVRSNASIMPLNTEGVGARTLLILLG